MYCKDCQYRVNGQCDNSEKIGEQVVGYGKEIHDQLSYSYNEDGWFDVGPYFGCVHFKKKS